MSKGTIFLALLLLLPSLLLAQSRKVTDAGTQANWKKIKEMLAK